MPKSKTAPPGNGDNDNDTDAQDATKLCNDTDKTAECDSENYILTTLTLTITGRHIARYENKFKLKKKVTFNEPISNEAEVDAVKDSAEPGRRR